MPEVPAGSGAERPLRADAQRNRGRLIGAARAVFSEAALGIEPSLEAVAKRAGVGIGTLYRHFPTRLDLLEAVYREDVDYLQTSSDELAETLPPWDALAVWLERFMGYATTKRAVFHELVDAIGRDSELLTHSREVIGSTSERLLQAAQDAGAVRADLTTSDLLRLVGGCSMMPGIEPDQQKRILDVVLAGIRS